MARFHSSGVGSGHHEESCVVLWNNQLYSGSCFGVEMPPKASSSFYDPHMPRQIHYFVLLFLLLLYLSSVNNAFMLRFFASSLLRSFRQVSVFCPGGLSGPPHPPPLFVTAVVPSPPQRNVHGILLGLERSTFKWNRILLVRSL